MEPIRILVLTSSTGGGHDARASAFARWVKRLYGWSVDVRIESMLEDSSPVARFGYVLASPAIPFVLFVRHWRTQQRLGNGGRFLRAARYVFPVLVAWSAGEAWGAIMRQP